MKAAAALLSVMLACVGPADPALAADDGASAAALRVTSIDEGVVVCLVKWRSRQLIYRVAAGADESLLISEGLDSQLHQCHSPSFAFAVMGRTTGNQVVLARAKFMKALLAGMQQRTPPSSVRIEFSGAFAAANDGKALYFAPGMVREAFAVAYVLANPRVYEAVDYRAAPHLPVEPLPKASTAVASPGDHIVREDVVRSILFGRMGECVLRLDAGGAHRLVRDGDDPELRRAAINGLMGALEACVPEDTELKVDVGRLRGAIAVAMIRIAGPGAAK